MNRKTILYVKAISIIVVVLVPTAFIVSASRLIGKISNYLDIHFLTPLYLKLEYLTNSIKNFSEEEVSLDEKIDPEGPWHAKFLGFIKEKWQWFRSKRKDLPIEDRVQPVFDQEETKGDVNREGMSTGQNHQSKSTGEPDYSEDFQYWDSNDLDAGSQDNELTNEVSTPQTVEDDEQSEQVTGAERHESSCTEESSDDSGKVIESPLTIGELIQLQMDKKSNQ